MLIHGGLAEDIDADRFWVRPGVVNALEGFGFYVDAPDRDTTPESWAHAADLVTAHLHEPATLIAGSNGVSVAIRVALQHPSTVRRLVLLWPATAGDPRVDQDVPAHAAHLLAGETVRGVIDAELATLSVPVAVMPSEPENSFHQRSTAERLVSLIPGSILIEPGFPESPRPDFQIHLDAFIAGLIRHISSPA